MSEATVVTPQGVRDGDPAMLRELAERRGAAVLAYAEQVAGPGLGVSAAAEAFARFRRAVLEADDPYALDPERTLLRGTRFAAAERAPAAPPLRARLRGAASAPCQRVPEMLAARAEGELGAADDDRLARHLVRCPSCQEAERRFRAGERAYRDQVDVPPPPPAANAIVHALTAAAPVRTPSADDADAALAAAPAPTEPPAQPTYEFEALPADAYDAEPYRSEDTAAHDDGYDAEAYAPYPAHAPRHPAGRRDDHGGFAARYVLPALILLVALLVTLAVAGVFGG